MQKTVSDQIQYFVSDAIVSKRQIKHAPLTRSEVSAAVRDGISTWEKWSMESEIFVSETSIIAPFEKRPLNCDLKWGKDPDIQIIKTFRRRK